MQIVSTIAALHAATRRWRNAGDELGFVPTMGNLHAGHLSLVEKAATLAGRVIVSTFVNPLQFGPGEDFETYPRTRESDRHMLAESGVDLLFAPELEEMYPEGREGLTQVVVPGLSDILCGARRPGHFAGVATVVTKLLNMVQPDVAVFGEKDYQQLLIIQRLVRDLNIPVKIVGAPTVREPDGLAMSSRNGYLTRRERAQAPALYRALCAACDGIASKNQELASVEAAGMAAVQAAGLRPEYFTVRRADDLAPPRSGDDRLVVLAAARLGKARLIDNVICAARGKTRN